MFYAHAEVVDEQQSILEIIKEDIDSSFIDDSAARLGQCIEEIEVAKLNCDDPVLEAKLDALYRAARLCGEGLLEVWSEFHLQKHA